AWRALKMWRRSWLSREVLLFGLFFVALFGVTLAFWLRDLHWQAFPAAVTNSSAYLAALIGITGILASAFIYLVPARPAWNMAHTPLDFLLSAAVLGSTFAPILIRIVSPPRLTTNFPTWPAACAAVLWFVNQGIRLLRLHSAELFEKRAT